MLSPALGTFFSFLCVYSSQLSGSTFFFLCLHFLLCLSLVITLPSHELRISLQILKRKAEPLIEFLNSFLYLQLYLPAVHVSYYSQICLHQKFHPLQFSIPQTIACQIKLKVKILKMFTMSSINLLSKNISSLISCSSFHFSISTYRGSLKFSKVSCCSHL